MMRRRESDSMQELQTVPSISLDEAVRLVRDLYGLEVSAERWPAEYDQNFRVTDTSGNAFVLKVMHPSREESFLDLQCHTLKHLARHAPTLAVPRVHPTAKGELFTRAHPGSWEHWVWLLDFIPGKVLADARPHSSELLERLGETLGAMDRALQDFSHPAATRDLKWDLTQAMWVEEHLAAIPDRARRERVGRVIERYRSDVAPRLPKLRKSVIHGDANDYNVLVCRQEDACDRSIGLIDFGDMHEGLIAAEPAVAATYALLGTANPLAAAASVVAGFHRALPLRDEELAVLFPLITMRLAVSVVNSALRKRFKPDDPYVTISEAPAWAALERLESVHPRFAHAVFRHACGWEPLPAAARIRQWLTNHRDQLAQVLDLDLRREPLQILDLGIGSTLLGADPKHSEGAGRRRKIAEALAMAGASVGIGRHDEPRWVSDSTRSVGREGHEVDLATVHIGMDIFLDAGAAVHAPLDGRVHAVAAGNANGLGAQVEVLHAPEEGVEFYTLYRHLVPAELSVGQKVEKGTVIGRIASAEERGGDHPHVHFQLAADVLDDATTFPGMIPAAEREVWRDLSPDPNLILGIPADRFPQAPSFAETLSRRRELLGGSLSISYRKPLRIVRGWRQYLYDDTGRPYLDVFNNVPLVGHSHPRIVEVVTRQLALLNTNTRYLHDTVLEYAERLTAFMPPELAVCFFVNSGSEANELAIRMARTHTRAEDVVVLENAYHGNTGTVTDISPYKFHGPGGTGRKPWVHVAPVADDYRGRFRRGEPDLGSRYAQCVADILDHMQSEGRRVAAFIAESMPSVGGQIVFPDGYLAEVYKHVRAAGGVCIADEVQVGFGRLGSAFWGFETQHVVPDIVVLAKPIGNCFPLAAVVTTREIAESFNNGMEFFSTYGGNPVSCAAGLAVLGVLREEDLQANARRVGDYLRDRLLDLQRTHTLIGDVRGMGLFLGVDLVLDRDTRAPATLQAGWLVNRLRERGVLAGTDGPYDNVIKLRPPLIMTNEDVDLFIGVLDSVLQEDCFVG